MRRIETLRGQVCDRKSLAIAIAIAWCTTQALPGLLGRALALCDARQARDGILWLQTPEGVHAPVLPVVCTAVHAQ